MPGRIFTFQVYPEGASWRALLVAGDGTILSSHVGRTRHEAAVAVFHDLE